MVNWPINQVNPDVNGIISLTDSESLEAQSTKGVFLNGLLTLLPYLLASESGRNAIYTGLGHLDVVSSQHNRDMYVVTCEYVRIC